MSRPAAELLMLAAGAALTIALPQPARRSLVGAFAAGETLFAAGLVLIVVGIGIRVWQRPRRPRAPGRPLLRLLDDAAGSDLALLGLAVNAAGAGVHPAALLAAGGGGRPDTPLLLGDLAAVLLVYVPLALLAFGRRHAPRPAPRSA